MNHKIFTLLALLITAVTATSCFGDDDEKNVTTYSDTAVTSFSLGTLLQKRDTVGKSGADSTYYKKLKGDAFSFYIDQNQGKIYNNDSLPYGTKTSAVLAEIATKNSGFVLLKSLTDDNFTPVNGIDSIDFSKPRTIRVYANDTQSYRTYIINVNVHRQRGDQFIWKTMTDNAAFGSFIGAKALSLGEKLFVFGTNGSLTKGYSTAITDGNAWQTLATSFPADAYKNFVANSSKLYTLSNGNVLSSTNAINWTSVTPNTPLKQLLFATDSRIYALSAAGNLVSSTNNGSTWNNETLATGNNPALLPTNNISTILLPTTGGEGVERLLMSGFPASSSVAISWTKLVSQYASYAWSIVDAASTTFALPAYKNLTILNYGGKAIALGQKSDNKLAPILLSTDAGITWKVQKNYTNPSVTAAANTFAATVDKNQRLWIISGNKVWKGILTELNWN